MKGLKLIFHTGGADFDFTTPVEDFDCLIQNSLVNIGSMKGTDRVFPDAGTNLFRSALNGALLDTTAAAHASNFAALSTLNFVQANDYSDDPNPLVGIILRPATFSRQRLTVDAQFTAADGTVKGILSTL